MIFVESEVLFRSMWIMFICFLLMVVSLIIEIVLNKFGKDKEWALFKISFGMFVIVFVIFFILMIGIFILIGVPKSNSMVEPVLEVVATTVSIMASGLLGISTLWYQSRDKKKDYSENLLPYFSIDPSKKNDEIIISFGSEDTKVPLQFVDVYLKYKDSKGNHKWKKKSFGSVWAKEDIVYPKKVGNYDLIVSAMTIKKQRVYFLYCTGVSENIKMENNEYILYPTKEKASKKVIEMIKSINY